MVAGLRGRFLPRWSKGYAGALIASGGCAGSQRSKPRHTTSVDLRRVEGPTSRIRPTDKLDIRALFEAELSCPNVLIDANGHIPLPLIGDVNVVDLTSYKLGNVVQTKLALHTKEPRVDFLIMAPVAVSIFGLC